MDTHSDSRFQTFNTNQAACMGALRIPIKQQQPVTIYKNGDDPSQPARIVFSFESAGHPFLDQCHAPAAIDAAWKNRAAFEAANPEHPLIPMRRALDKRDWLVKVYHRQLSYAESKTPATFATTDIDFAAALMASGVRFLRLKRQADDTHYLFGAIPRTAIRDYENYLEDGKEGTAFALMHRALEARNLFAKLVKDPRCVPVLEYFNGDPMDGGRVAHIPEGTPDAEREALLDELYSG